MSLVDLQDRLQEKDFLKCLLQADKPPFDPPKDLKNIEWEVLPYYLPSVNPRITFHLRTDDGEYLLKLNTETHKIHREVAACRLFYTLNSPELMVPKVYAAETQVFLSKKLSCGWLIAEWVSGIPATKAADDLLVELLPQGLLKLHKQPISRSNVESIFGMPMPGNAKAQEILHERRKEYFEQALEVCTPKLVPIIRQLEDMVCAHTFTSHLAFIHGDMHVNNIKYHQEAHKTGYRLFMFDWEDISIDHPLYDLANLMFSDGFSYRSIQCMRDYRLIASEKAAESDLDFVDAWMLAIVCFVRYLRWKFGTSVHANQQLIEIEAEKTIQRIGDAYISILRDFLPF